MTLCSLHFVISGWWGSETLSRFYDAPHVVSVSDCSLSQLRLTRDKILDRKLSVQLVSRVYSLLDNRDG